MLEVSMIHNEQNRIILQLRKFLFKFGTPSFGIVRRILQNAADKCMVSDLPLGGRVTCSWGGGSDLPLGHSRCL